MFPMINPSPTSPHILRARSAHGGNVDRDLLTPQLEPEMNLIRCKHSAPVRDCLSCEQLTTDDHRVAQRR
jgi:hypothetical protein